MIAIISILMALLMPALKNAKASAKSAACMSNLRQIYLSFALYANDWNDTVAGGNAGVGVPDYCWWQTLGNSKLLGSVDTSTGISRWKVLQCPSEKAPSTYSGVTTSPYTTTYYDATWCGCSYAINYSVAAAGITHRVGFSKAPTGPGTINWYGGLVASSRESAPFLMDCHDVGSAGFPQDFSDTLDDPLYWRGGWASPQDGYYYAFRHSGRRANLTYMDGHVSSIRAAYYGGITNFYQLFENAPP